MNKKVIIGYSGHSYVVIDAAVKAGLNIQAYTERVEKIHNPFQLEYLGFENSKDFRGWNKGYEYILGVGDNLTRESVTELLISKKEKLFTVIHPSAKISSFVDIDQGTFIGVGAMINPFVKIGMSVIINTGAIVEHDCEIGNFTHIAPGAVLGGMVEIGNRSFIGANSIVKEGVKIGDDVTIGAGTVVLKNVKNGCKIVGNPGKLI